MTTRLMFDRRWIVNWDGPNAPRGRYDFRLAPPVKPAAPVIVSDKPWESMSSGWGTLRIEEGRWRLWYEAWDDQYKDDFDGRLCYAESEDGVTWVKPELGLVEFRGSKANNIILDGRMTGCGFHGHSVFVDPTSPPEARYRMIFMSALRRWDKPEQGYSLYPMSFAYSADGIQWKWGLPPGQSWLNPPFVPFGSDTQTVVRWDEGLRQYVGYFRTWEPGYGRTIGRAVTSDFGRWPHPETILTADEQDPFGTDLYNNAASVYRVPGDEGHFFFISTFDHASDTLAVQLATSRDGWHYRRLCRDRFVAPGQTFDRGGIYTCPGIHRAGDDLVMMYHAVPFKHGEATPSKIRHAGSYVVLRFHVDRFQGLHADGEFEFSVPAERGADGRLQVTLNAIVAPGGRIRAGVLPARREQAYLPGFAPGDSQPVTGDGTALPLVWKGGAVPAHPKDEPLEVRLIMEKATLFSYSF
jgi:hypothetical protein